MTTSGTPPNDASSHGTLVAFRLERQIYGLPIEPVVQIIEMVTITPLPQTSGYLEGVINVRGEAVPVINLRCQLGLPRLVLELQTPIILVRARGRMFGLIVDEVTDVLGIASGQVIRAADVLPPGMAELPFLQGLAHLGDRTVLLLDVERLLEGRPMAAAAEVLRVLPEVSIPAPGEPVPTPAELLQVPVDTALAAVEAVQAAAEPAPAPAEAALEANA